MAHVSFMRGSRAKQMLEEEFVVTSHLGDKCSSSFHILFHHPYITRYNPI